MRISDWSSDVCSSDLFGAGSDGLADPGEDPGRAGQSDQPLAYAYLSSRHRLDTAPTENRAGDRSAGVCDHGLSAIAVRRRVYAQYGRGRSALHALRSEEHTSELQSLMRISYAVFCLKKKKQNQHKHA